MVDTDLDQTTVGDIKSEFASGTENYYSVPSETTDGPTGTKETEWINERFADYLGFYKNIPELQASIDAKATWTVGRGFEADEPTTMLLDTIKGWGKDTFNSILENAVRTYHIGGDSFAEIILDDKGILINLKPLDPSVIKIVASSKGRIVRYEQMGKNKKPIRTFEPDKIFHLARNRLADEIHGVSIVPAIENIILYRNRAMADWDRVLHHNVDPVLVVHLDTDDQTKIDAFKAKFDAAKGRSEVIYVPKGNVEIEPLTIAPNATLNPLAWIESLNNYFYQAVGVPQIVVGGTGAITEAAVKIAYLSFEQTTRKEQLFVEENVLSQLNLVINLVFPVSLQNEALTSKEDAESPEVENPNNAIEANDETAEIEGKK